MTESVPNDKSGLSLLSLSIAASSADPIPVDSSHTSVSANGRTHRRLSSTGKARRRMSDARDAATRPSPGGLQPSSASSLSALATLSLSTSPPSASNAIAIPSGSAVSEAGDDEDESGSVSKSGKKRGTTFVCESCSKVYRHPSCLIKHRWEHSPHWREASKFVLSKHQQVQLLEAAAILSHISPTSATGTSLPEDRSLWPSFLSNGALPPPSTSPSASSVLSTSAPRGGVSASVPARAPRMHDYSVRAGSVTQLRPGLLGAPSAGTVAMEISPSPPPPLRGVPIKSEPHAPAWSSADTSSGGWSLPRSSLRSSPSDPDGDSEPREDAWSVREDDAGLLSGKGKARVEEWEGLEVEMMDMD